MTTDILIGRVLRASTRGFDCGAHSKDISPAHDFGAFVKVPITNSKAIYAIGLIYKVEIKDDQLITELVMGESVPDAILRDQRENRMVPVEIKMLSVGYYEQNEQGQRYYMPSMPPRPPMTLSDVIACTEAEVRDFCVRHDFFRLVLGAAEVPSDDLIAAAIRRAAFCYGDMGYDYLVSAGQQLARDMSGDLKRLAHILALLNPSEG